MRAATSTPRRSWKNLLDDGWADGAVRGAAVQAIGQVDRYEARGRAKRQLKLTAPVRVLPRDGLDLSQFLPHIDEDARSCGGVDRMRPTSHRSTLRRVIGLFFADDDFRVRFERTPASSTATTPRSAACCCMCWR